jgi:hypothetical protein
MVITKGGYLPYEAVITSTNHCCLWIDISFESKFGHNMPSIIWASMRRLQCKDPRTVKNFIKVFRESIEKEDLLNRPKLLEQRATFPMSKEDKQAYEDLDRLHCLSVAWAERKCRKLKAGMVGFSPTIQLLMRRIHAWALFRKRAQGKKVSSCLLSRTLKKANLSSRAKGMGLKYLEEQRKRAYELYQLAKENARDIRETYLSEVAEACAQENKGNKEKVLRQLVQVEKQWATARRIKYIQGKLQRCSTFMVQEQDNTGTWQDVTEKATMEKAIMESTRRKYTSAFNSPFLTIPLVTEFGYLSNGAAAKVVLSGTYKVPSLIDHYTKQCIEYLKKPVHIAESGDHPKELLVTTYRNY